MERERLYNQTTCYPGALVLSLATPITSSQTGSPLPGHPRTTHLTPSVSTRIPSPWGLSS